MKLNMVLAGVLGVGAWGAVAQAGNPFLDEVNFGGDFSNNGLAPTALLLVPGPNDVHGHVGAGDTRDFITITVPAGFQLSGYTNYLYRSSDPQGFTGMHAGGTFPGDPFQPGSYAGYAHFGSAATNPPLAPGSTVGVNLLPIMANPAVSLGATGMGPNLSPGTYTFMMQQLGAADTEYGFTFTLTVPTPSAAGLLGLGALGLMRRSRR